MLPRWTLFIRHDKCVDLQSNYEIKKEVDFFSFPRGCLPHFLNLCLCIIQTIALQASVIKITFFLFSKSFVSIEWMEHKYFPAPFKLNFVFICLK